jgi:hypothetical protein
LNFFVKTNPFRKKFNFLKLFHLVGFISLISLVLDQVVASKKTKTTVYLTEEDKMKMYFLIDVKSPSLDLAFIRRLRGISRNCFSRKETR